MKSKSFQRFKDQIRELNRYLQVMDCALTIANQKCNKNRNECDTIAKCLNKKINTHGQLNIPSNANDIRRIFVFSRHRLTEHAIIELYSLFADYIANIIKDISRSNAISLIELLTKENDSITFIDILKCNSYDSIIDELAVRVFRKLENERSTTKLLRKIIRHFKLNIDDSTIRTALIFLELRHLIIHNNSKADEKFKKINTSSVVKYKKTGDIIFNYNLTQSAIGSIYKLCVSINNQMIAKNLIE